MRNIRAVPSSQFKTTNEAKNKKMEPPSEVEADNADMSISSTINGGVAERLLMYSQKLMDSLGCV